MTFMEVDEAGERLKVIMEFSTMHGAADARLVMPPAPQFCQWRSLAARFRFEVLIVPIFVARLAMTRKHRRSALITFLRNHKQQWRPAGILRVGLGATCIAALTRFPLMGRPAWTSSVAWT